MQSLNGALIDEMTLYFTPTCPTTLICEIIADLKKPPTSKGRIGEDLVRQLATKMTGAHGAQPPLLRSLVVGSVHGRTADERSQLPVMVVDAASKRGALVAHSPLEIPGRVRSRSTPREMWITGCGNYNSWSDQDRVPPFLYWLCQCALRYSRSRQRATELYGDTADGS
jgi:hypothetical protein